jgi:2-methylcitrate dehydratase PrpD
MDEEAAVNALAFAANFASGFNQWPSSGGQEIYVHAGMAARNGLIALDLGRAGLRASPDILEGGDGLFRAIGSGPEAPSAFLNKLAGPNCLLEVTHKPTAGCNFVQTAAAAAVRLSRQLGAGGTEGIRKILISTFTAARDYPGCNNTGPFDYVEQRKNELSIRHLHGAQQGAT